MEQAVNPRAHGKQLVNWHMCDHIIQLCLILTGLKMYWCSLYLFNPMKIKHYDDDDYVTAAWPVIMLCYH